MRSNLERIQRYLTDINEIRLIINQTTDWATQYYNTTILPTWWIKTQPFAPKEQQMFVQKTSLMQILLNK